MHPLSLWKDRALTPVLDLVFPLQCLGCRAWGQVICNSCAAGLTRLEPPFCST